MADRGESQRCHFLDQVFSLALSTEYKIEKQMLQEDLKYGWKWLQWRGGGGGLNIVGTNRDLEM